MIIRALLFLLLSFGILCAQSGISEENVIEVSSPAQSDSSAIQTAASDTIGSDSLPAITKMPEIKYFEKAEYPTDLVKKGLQGDVTMDLVVSDSGTVDSVAVVKGFNALLDSNAVRAARKFRFSPAMADTIPVPVILQYVYHYSLGEVVTKIDTFVNFKGRCVERGTRTPIADAMIIVSFTDTTKDTSLALPFSEHLKKIGRFPGQSLQGSSMVTTSDSLGNFSFYSLPSCTISVKVVVPDYEPFTEKEVLKHGLQTDVTYRIQRISYGDNEIVVYGKIDRKEVATHTLTLNEVRKIPGLGGDAVKVVQTLPGVARGAFGAGALVVRGAGGGDTRYFLDGVELPLLFHFGGLKSTYNSDALKSVDLYPGGFGTRYGGATAGIVEIQGRSAKTDRYHGYLDGNFFDASFLVEGPVTKNVSILATARRSYIADVIALALKSFPDINLLFTAVPYYWDYVLRTDVSVKDHQGFVTLFGMRDRLDLIQSQVRGGSADIDSQTNRLVSDQIFNMGIAGWDWNIAKKHKNTLRYSATYATSGISAFGFFKMDGSGWINYFRDQYSYTPSEQLTLNAGADVRVWPYRLVLILPGGSGKIIKDTTNYLFGPWGAYVNAEYKPIPSLTLMPGLRYDYYPELIHDGGIVPEFWNYQDFNNHRGISGEPSLRLTAKYQIDKKNKLKGSLGNYNQSPRPDGQAIHKKWGNPSLPTEKSSQYVLGYEWQITDLISADIQAYHNEQWDNARQAGAADLVKNPTVLYYGDGRARMNGIEILLKQEQSKHLFGWISYSLGRSERYNYAEKKWSLYSEDQTHNLQLIASYRFKGNRELGVRARYVTGNPTTPIKGIEYYDATYNFYQPIYGAVNSGRVDPYFSVDLRYERKFAFRHIMFDVYLDIVNLSNLFGYGYRSPEIGQYIWNYDYTDKQIISDITRPALGLKLEF